MESRTQNRISKQRPTAGLDRINLAGETVPGHAEGQNDNRDDRARRMRALGDVVGELLGRSGHMLGPVQMANQPNRNLDHLPQRQGHADRADNCEENEKRAKVWHHRVLP